MLKYALLAFTILASTGAHAITANAYTDHFNPTQADGSIAGAFDMSGLFAPLAAAGNTITVQSATVRLFGFSGYEENHNRSHSRNHSYSYQVYVPERTESYPCGYFFLETCYRTVPGYSYRETAQGTTLVTEIGDTVIDAARMDFGAGSQIIAGQISGGSPGYTTYTSNPSDSYRTETRRFFATGDLNVFRPLDARSVAALSDDWILDYNLQVTAGQFSFLEAHLFLDYSVISAPVMPPSPVPLPATLPLLLGGLAGVFSLRRRKKSAT